MNDQLEQDLATAFGEHAGGVVDTGVLAVSATRRGRRLRARTYAVRCAAAVAVVAVVTAGALSVHRSPVVPLPGGSASAPASPDRDWIQYPPPDGWSVPPLPAAGVPADPSKVGTDPSLLHFTVDEWAVDSPYTTWRSTAGLETISFRRGDAAYQVFLAKAADTLDFELSKQGDGNIHHERWQPAPGLWAEVFSRNALDAAADAGQIKSRLRLDTTVRCTTPIQLSNLPAGAGLLGCEVTLAGGDLPGRLLNSTVWVGENNSDQAQIMVTRRNPSPSPGTLTLGGRPARVFTDDQFRPSVEFPDANGLRIHLAGTGTYGSPTLIVIAEGLRIASSALDPTTWPVRLVI
ncbi:hypothetical protein AB0K00_41000 [Dactylosporangium sp. NPDC049525]|uniref:hypothetical protein n=1 Tax=Dactylosporangium sp. NPDC049525 TaxID=3154730 RepID=UPI0034391279